MPDPNLDLNTVIQDSIDDAQIAPETPEVEVEESTPAPELEAAPEAIEAAEEVIAEEASTPKSKSQVFEDFDKKFGIEPNYPNSGRENRIPYSRVKKIAQKAVREARKEWETEYTPKTKEWETTKANYEKELTQYKNFEKIMMNDQEKFLTMLSRLPAYQPFFTAVQQAIEALEAKGQAPAPQAPVQDDMPQPDQQLSDGSYVYSMEGLRQLNAWNRDQAKKEALAEAEKRYGPIESEWQAHKRVEALRPAVNQQIAEARTWEGFTDNEAEIVKTLQDNPRISLEGAYRQVVIPKLKAAWEAEKAKLVPERNKMRQDVITELQSAPKATSVPSTANKAGATGEPKTLEEIIADSIKGLPR